MAIPVWVPFALMAASAGANYQAQKKVDNERSAEYAKFMRDKLKSDQEAESAIAKTISEYEDQRGKQEEAAVDLADQYKTQQVQSADLPAVQTSAAANTTGEGGGAEISDWGQERRAGSKRYTEGLADALGRLRSFDQAFGDSALATADNRMDLRRIAGDRRGSQRVLEGGLMAANEAGKGWGTLGDALSLAAMATSMGAMAAPAAAPGAAASTGVSTAGTVAPTMAASNIPAYALPTAQAAMAPASTSWMSQFRNLPMFAGMFSGGAR